MKASKLIFAAICAGAIIASCAPQDVEEVIVPAPSQEEVLPAQLCTISIDATKGIDSKALALDGTKLTATWESGETVAVYKKGSTTKLGTLSPKTTGVATTSLEGDVDISGLAVNDELFLLYPDRGWTYDGQDGTLETVSSDYDFATATVKVTSVSSTHMSAESAAFKNQQAIVKFNLKNKDGGAALATPDFTIVSKNNKLVRYHDMNFDPEPSDNFCFKVGSEQAKSELTLAIASVDDSADDYYFLAETNHADPVYYELLKENIHFDHGKYYSGNLSLSQVSYTVAGSPKEVFGGDYAWDPTRADNDMEFNGSYFFKSFDDVPAGSIIELKVVKNHAWSGDGGAEYPSKNVIVTAWADGSLGVTYYPFGNVVEAAMFYPGGAPASIPDIYTLAFQSGGDFFLNTPADDLADNGDGTYSYSTVLEAGNYYFKIFKNRAYNVAEWPYDSPYYVNVTEKSTINVTFTPATNDIQVSLVPYTAPTPAPLWSVIGDFNSWDSDVDMVLTGSNWVSPETLMHGKFKIRNNHQWTDSRGYATADFTATPGVAFAVVSNGRDIILPEKAYYIITYDPAAETILVEKTSTPVPVENHDYTVAGEPVSVFGASWDPSVTGNDMVKQSDGTYLKTYTVSAATDFQFKVVKDHSFGNGDWPSSNYVITVPGAGTLYIVFDPAADSGNGAVTAWAEANAYSLPGIFNGWDVNALMVKQSDGTYKYTKAMVPEGDYEYKVLCNNDWSSGWNYGKDNILNGANYEYHVAALCDLDFVFDPRTASLTVTEVPFVYAITLDGVFSDWSSVTSYPGGGDRITEWRITSDAVNIYMYFKFTTAIAKARGIWNAYLVAAFDTDNDSTTGDTGNYVGDGYEVYTVAYPVTNAAGEDVVLATSPNSSSKIEYPIGTKVDGLGTVGAIDGEYVLVEYCIPRDKIGSPVSGSTIGVRVSMASQPAARQEVVLN